MLVIGTAVLLSSVAVVLDEYLASPRTTLPDVPRMLAIFSAAFLITNLFAVWTASSLRLRSFLLLEPLSMRRRWLRMAIYGVGTGLFIYWTNNALYLSTAASPFRAPPVYDLDSHLKVFALSARAALAEETMYRLFAIPFLVSLGMRLRGWRPSFGFESGPVAPSPEPARPPRGLILGALVVSAVLFGLAHATNPVAAGAFGLLLGAVFLRAGWEAAVTAHFLGNYLLFAGIYL